MRITIDQLNEVETGGTACWSGLARLPGARHPVKLLIFAISGSYRAIRARCPHQGVDMSGCDVSADGALKCPAHGLVLNVVQGPDSFAAERQGQDFTVII